MQFFNKVFLTSEVGVDYMRYVGVKCCLFLDHPDNIAICICLYLKLFSTKIYYLMLTYKLNMCMMNTLQIFWFVSTHYKSLGAPKQVNFPTMSHTNKHTHLMRGSLWSLMTFMVTSQALRKMPSQPMGPIASTMLWVIRNGTLSGQSNVSPCGNMRSNAVISRVDLQWQVLKFVYFD